MTDTTAPLKIAQNTTFTVLFAIAFCHLLNDMMQAVIPAIYPTLTARENLEYVLPRILDHYSRAGIRFLALDGKLLNKQKTVQEPHLS